MDQPDNPENEWRRLQRRFAAWSWLYLAALFSLAGLAVLVWWLALLRLAAWRFSLFNQPAQALLPLPVQWLLPALFLGLLTGALVLDKLNRLLLRDGYDDWLRYEYWASWAPKTAQRTARILAILTLVACLVSIFLFLDQYALAYPDRLVVNPLLGLRESHYAYGEITAIRESDTLIEPDGEQVAWGRPIYVVEFTGGRCWSTRWETADRDPTQLAALVNYISQRSGAPIQMVAALTQW